MSDSIEKTSEGSVNQPNAPKMVPANLLGKRKLTKVGCECFWCTDLFTSL
jgi:hypothetical protein